MQTDRITAMLEAGGRILLAGAPGVGKSTCAASLAAQVGSDGIVVGCIACDPGSPAFGAPGAVNLGEWDGRAWKLRDLEPLCTLDAARFRLPLIQAVTRLLERTPSRPLLLDAPGVVRGVAGAELLVALATACRVDGIVVLEHAGRPIGLEHELASLDAPVWRLCAAEEASSPSKRARARRRTELWEAYLAQGEAECVLDLDTLAVVGTPPPRSVPASWQRRQAALLRGGACIGFGEIVAATGDDFRMRIRGAADGVDTLLVRDARRSSDGTLCTAKPAAPPAGAPELEPDVAEQPTAARVVRAGPFTATLVNGVFGDPLLLVRMRHRSRVLLFDLGESNRLGARTAHQVTDVFITHAHIDHINGFLWLLRSRIGDFPPCRLYGPPGIAANVAGLVNGVHWDRAGEGAPRFDVVELHPEERLVRFAVRAGETQPRRTGEAPPGSGLLLDEPMLRVRAVTLDHLTPVLAFALESALELNVRKERLDALGVPPGRWLAQLKQEIAAGRADAVVELPNGSRRTARSLADELLLIRPGTKLAYATDLADTSENRRRLAELARKASVLFCESTFRNADRDKAQRTGHLTAAACGEIAAAAGVERLVPFHFSRRYETDAGAIYREVEAACSRVVSPAGMAQPP